MISLSVYRKKQSEGKIKNEGMDVGIIANRTRFELNLFHPSMNAATGLGELISHKLRSKRAFNFKQRLKEEFLLKPTESTELKELKLCQSLHYIIVTKLLSILIVVDPS